MEYLTNKLSVDDEKNWGILILILLQEITVCLAYGSI